MKQKIEAFQQRVLKPDNKNVQAERWVSFTPENYGTFSERVTLSYGLRWKRYPEFGSYSINKDNRPVVVKEEERNKILAAHLQDKENYTVLTDVESGQGKKYAYGAC